MDKENQEESDIVVLSETEDDNDAMNCSMDVEEVLVNAENFRLIDQDGREISLEDHVNYCRNDSADENVQEEEQNTSTDQVSYTLNERDGLVIQVKEGNSSQDHVDYCMNKNVGVVVKVPKGNTLNKTPVKRKLATEPKIVRIEDILTSKVNSVGKLELRRVGNPFKINVSNLKTTENTPKINVPEGSLLTKENPPRVNLPGGSQTKENQPKNMSAERRNLALKRMKRKQLCRLCLAKNCDLLPLFETSLRFSVTPLQEVIESCFGMQVSAEDVYDQICPSCVTSLENFWNFRDKCQQSNTVIEQMNMRWEQQAAMKARSQNPKPTPVKNVEVSCTICGEKVRNEFLKDHYERHKSTGEGPGASEEFVVEMEELIRNLESAEGDFECPADDSSYDRIPDPEPDIPSEQIPGKKSNTWTYADGRGFYFKLEKRNKDKAYMACIDKTCRMRGVMLLGKEGAPIRITTPTLKHTHPENFELGEKLKIIHHFKKRSIEESHLNITKILEEESVGVDLGMKNKIKRAMSEARKSKGLPFAGNSAVEEQEEEENGRPSMKFPGPKASWIYTDGTGYFYQAKRINRNGKRILNCINQDCSSTARMALDEDAPICAATEHSHPPSSMTFTPEELEVQRKLTSAFGSETVGFTKAKQSHVDAKSLKRAMARARRSATNRNSQNVFADNLEAAVGHILQ